MPASSISITVYENPAFEPLGPQGLDCKSDGVAADSIFQRFQRARLSALNTCADTDARMKSGDNRNQGWLPLSAAMVSARMRALS